jgi:uncharacterized protein (UPF0276 family)
MIAWSRLDLGVGLVACGGVDQVWSDITDLVDVVEVEPQPLWDHSTGDGRRLERRALRWLRSLDRPLLSHGVGFPVGGTTPPEADGVRASAESARELDAVHWSEHLSFNRAGHDHAGYLLPPVPSTDVVDAAVSHIRTYQQLFDRPFLVETPASYLRPTPGDLTDARFVTEIAERADCGILLDLHNIWTNERNGRQPVRDFLAELPLERVWEIHLAGGLDFAGYYLDAHVGPVPRPLLDLARDTVPRLPNIRALIFEAVPESVVTMGGPGLRAVLEQLHELARLPAITSPVTPRRASTPTSGTTTSAPTPAAEREARLLAYTTRASELVPGSDPGAEVLRCLTDEARLSLLVGRNSEQLRLLYRTLGATRARTLLERFLAETKASSWPDEQSAALTAWLDDNPDILDSRRTSYRQRRG